MLRHLAISKHFAEAKAPILWPPDTKNQLIEKTLMLGKIEGRRRRGQQRMRWLNSITNSMGMNLSKLPETVKNWEAWHALVHGVIESDMDNNKLFKIYECRNIHSAKTFTVLDH